MWIKKVISFLSEKNYKYDYFVENHQAQTIREKSFYILMHILPGLLAFLSYLFLFKPLVSFWGINTQNAQLIILLIDLFL